MLTADRIIDAAAEEIWDVLVDVRFWPVWGPVITHVDLSGPDHIIELGSSGVVRTSVGLNLPFIVTEFDPVRKWAWRVVGVPATGHRLDRVEHRTKVTFEVPWWASPYLAVCTLALQRIEALVTS